MCYEAKNISKLEFLSMLGILFAFYARFELYSYSIEGYVAWNSKSN